MGIYRTPRGLVNRVSNCKSIFGGTPITRYYLKRKVPLFVTDAMGLASLTPFDYKYNNIGYHLDFIVTTNWEELKRGLISYSQT
jgi:hypothetical protein